jgi:hypothetical protein
LIRSSIIRINFNPVIQLQTKFNSKADKIVSLFKAGSTVADIADKFDISKKCAQQIVSNHSSTTDLPDVSVQKKRGVPQCPKVCPGLLKVCIISCKHRHFVKVDYLVVVKIILTEQPLNIINLISFFGREIDIALKKWQQEGYLHHLRSTLYFCVL